MPKSPSGNRKEWPKHSLWSCHKKKGSCRDTFKGTVYPLRFPAGCLGAVHCTLTSCNVGPQSPRGGIKYVMGSSRTRKMRHSCPRKDSSFHTQFSRGRFKTQCQCEHDGFLYATRAQTAYSECSCFLLHPLHKLKCLFLIFFVILVDHLERGRPDSPFCFLTEVHLPWFRKLLSRTLINCLTFFDLCFLLLIASAQLKTVNVATSDLLWSWRVPLIEIQLWS